MILIIDLLHIYYRCWYSRDKYDEIIADSGRNVAHVKTTFDECLKIIDDAAFHYDEDEITVFVCLDRNSRKKELYPEYKVNRKNRLDAGNYAEIDYIAHTLEKRGAVILAEDGYEADDLVYTIVRNLTLVTPTKGEVEEIVIYTSDADLLMHVGEHVDVRLRRQTAYLPVTRKLFVKQMGFICKRDAWFNDVVLYKSCVGDPSDNIKGVRGFGDAAYKKRIIAAFERSKQQFGGLIPFDYAGALDFAKHYMGFSSIQLEEFAHALEMVFPLYCEELEMPIQKVPVSQLLKGKK